MKKLEGNMLIAQSGGPTVVINQSLIGAVLEARKYKQIKKVYGSMHGIQGILNEDFVDLSRESEKNLLAVGNTPSSALGSVRKKPTTDDCKALFEVMKKYDVRYFFYIGGNDSAETTHIINEEARKQRYEFRCYHICKTIDNDLRENDHTPGYGTGAKFVASAFMGDNLDNRALGGVKINIIMGRHAGFLTAASALARVHEGDGPHLIYLPERPFSIPQFCRDIKKTLETQGRCVVAVSEGIADAKGKAIATKFIKEVDAHGNVQLGGTGALGDMLSGEVKKRLKISRVRADTFGYLQRSFPGMASPVDAREAFAVGQHAVRNAVKSFANGSIAIKRRPGARYSVTFKRVPIKNVAKYTKHMPDAFINKEGNDVTEAFLKYARPLTGPLPKIGRLKYHRVKKIS